MASSSIPRHVVPLSRARHCRALQIPLGSVLVKSRPHSTLRQLFPRVRRGPFPRIGRSSFLLSGIVNLYLGEIWPHCLVVWVSCSSQNQSEGKKSGELTLEGDQDFGVCRCENTTKVCSEVI